MNERKQYISLIREIAIALVLLTYPFMFIHAMSYESTFAVFAIVGIIARRYCVKNDLRIDSKAKVLYVLLAALISGMFIIADYSLFIDGTKLSLLKIPVAFIDGFIAFAGIFLSAYDILLNAKYVEHKKDKKFPFLLAAFLAPVIVDNIYLRFCAYPG